MEAPIDESGLKNIRKKLLQDCTIFEFQPSQQMINLGIFSKN
jgi:hypothetical protein